MAVHHTLVKKAEKAGIALTDREGGGVQAHWAGENQRLVGESAKHVLDDMLTLQSMRKNWASFKYAIHEDHSTVTISVRGTTIQATGRAQVAFQQAKEAWENSRAELDEDDEEEDAEVQAEVDAEVEAEEGKSGSVVAQRYRAIYAERGHPTHCGDWLADLLVNICTNKEGINTELFEAICLANGVDTSGYKHEGHGWQGRLRMTGRNRLAKVVFLNGGDLRMPETVDGGKTYKAPAEWMDTRRFKRAKETA